MANKQILSVVAASILAASFTLTGCGSSSSSSSSSSSVASSSSMASSSSEGSPIHVTVSDAYVYDAMVKIGDTEYKSANGAIYEFPAGTAEGIFRTIGGANDTNGNGVADTEDPVAPAMAAPAGYQNITPFTTMEANGMTLTEIQNKYPSLAAMTSLDFDVTTADLAVYKDAAKAGLALSNGDTPPASSSSVASSSSEDTSSSSSEQSGSGAGLPGNSLSAVLRTGLPGHSIDGSVPSSSSEVSSSSSEGSSSSQSDLDAIYQAIDDAPDMAAVDAIIKVEMAKLNGNYEATASSSSSEECIEIPGSNNCEDSSSSEEASSSSEEASSSSEEASSSSVPSGSGAGLPGNSL